MQKFFHLPSLYVYLIAAILLVTSVFHAASFIRQALYLVLELSDSAVPIKYSNDVVNFTPAAESFLNEMAAEQARRTNQAGMIRSLIMLAVSLGGFAFFWRRTNRSHNIEMDFTVRHFYFFAVSTIAFLIFFFSISAGVSNLVNQAVNVEWMYYHYDVHRFHGARVEGQPIRTVDIDEVRRNLEQQRRDQRDQYSSQQRQVVDQLTVAVVAFPVFFLHDRRFAF